MKVSIIDQDPERLDQLAELLADGVYAKDIAKVFGVHRDTVGEWKKRPDVQTKVSQLIKQRANNILSKTDTKILKRLESEKELPIEILLQVRRTFAGEKLTVDTKATSADATAELLQAIHQNPELAKAIGQAKADGDDD
jgi:transposase